MKKWIKLVSLTVVFLLAAMAVFGCQAETTPEPEAEAPQAAEPAAEEPAAEEPAAEEPAADDPAALTADITAWMSSRSPELEQTYEDAVAAFNEIYPNVNITLEHISQNDMQPKTQAAILAGTTPDIIGDFIGRTGVYINADLLVPLDDIFTDDYKALFFEPILNQGMKDGSVYIYPERADYYLMNVNKTLFDEAGATDLLPLEGDRTWTREECEAALAAVSKDGVYGMGLWAGNEQSDINTKIMIEGGMSTSLYSDDFQTVQYDSPEAIEGLEWLVSLIEKGYAAPDSDMLVDDEVWQLYAQKKVAILPTTAEPFSWIPAQIADGIAEEPFEIVAVQFPTAEGDTSKTAAPMSGYGIFKNDNDENKIAAAKAFLKFLGESEYSVDIIREYGSFPAMQANSDMYSDNPELTWIAETLGNYVYDAGYASNGFADVRMALYPEVQAAYSGSKTAEEAMTDFTAMANDILAQANAG